MRKTFTILFVFSLIASFNLNLNAQIIFTEDFETGSIPSGWSQDYIIGTENWTYNNGGNSGNPSSAHGGSFNALFFYGSYGDETTKLITPQIDITTVTTPILKFWHAQHNWGGDQDELYIYYRTDAGSSWQLLESYTSAVTSWTQREILLPDATTTYQIAFEAKTGYGYGVCVDDVTIEEAPPVSKFVNAINVNQHETTFVYQNSTNNPILRIDVEVGGNSGTLFLEDIIATSLNTTDSDLAVNGVKLYYTGTDVFNTDNQLGTSVNMVGGISTFSGLNYDLPPGMNYLWVCYDIKPDATPYNIVDALIEANDITIDGTTYPVTDESPAGEKEILEPIYYDNFTTNLGWTLTGEFEIAVPTGLGGSYGDPDPTEAYIGTQVLGTDLTGLGTFPGDYEPNLSDKAYIATSPIINCTYFQDVTLRFEQWLNLDFFDNATIEISTDGSIWDVLWQSSALMEAETWELKKFDISTYADFEPQVQIRFTLGTSDGTWNFSGWNIDEFVLTGDFLSNEVEVTDIIAPASGCGHTDTELITIVVENHAGQPTNDTLPLCFSIDGGTTVIYDTIFSSIPIGEDTVYTFVPTIDLTTPGVFDQVFAATLDPLDEDPGNDTLFSNLLIAPTNTIPYFEDFETGDGNWVVDGVNATWELGVPAGTVINTAASGSYSWVTNLSGNYSDTEVSWVESPCFNFTDVYGAVIEFEAWWSSESGFDGTAVQYTIDDFTWTTIGSFGDDVNWYDHDFVIGLTDGYGTDHGWCGESGGWVTVSHPLPVEINNQSSVKFRIIFGSNSVTNSYEGFAFDDVSIYKLPPDVGVISIDSPESACKLSDQVNLSVSIVNFGLDTISSGESIPVGYQINSGSVVLDTLVLTTDLNPTDTISFTFDNDEDMSAEGDYDISSFTILYGDYIPDNDSASALVSVWGNPVVDLGADIFTLAPDTVILDAWIGPDHTYLWQDGSTDSIFDVSIAGIYFVEVTDTFGCEGRDTIEVLTVNIDVSITEVIFPASACELGEDEAIRIKITNTGEYTIPPDTLILVSYSINGGPQKLDSIVMLTSLPPASFLQYTFDTLADLSAYGDYNFMFIVDMAMDNNPDNDTMFHVISAHGPPFIDIGPDTLLTNQPDTVVLNAGAGFSSYLWQDGSTDSTYYVPGVGTYHVYVIDSHGCENSDTIYIDLIDNIITDEFPSSLIYPNPTFESVYIEMQDNLLYTYILFDVHGRIIQSGDFMNQLSLDLSSNLPGFYMIKISDSTSEKTFKVKKL